MKYRILTFMLTFFFAAYANDPFALPTPDLPQSILLQIHYADAQNIATLLKQTNSGLLSDTAHLIVNRKQNQLWIEDTKPHLNKIKTFINSVDKAENQILIKAKIILIDDTASRELGVYFKILQDKDHSESGIDLPLIKINNQHILDIKLNALAEKGHAFILSSPEIVTNNRNKATIESGEEIPYQEKGRYGNSTLTFKTAALHLDVTPSLLPNNQVNLSLLINQDKPSHLFINGAPAINTEKLKTRVTIQASHTLILGGIHEQNFSRSQTHVPIISKIPLLGLLFRSNQKQSQHKQLVIMITPSVLPSNYTSIR